MESHQAAASAKDAKATAAEIAKLIHGLDGFDVTNRGYQGGYRLARRPEDYTARDILRLTEGSLAPVACLDCEVNTCPRSANCPTLPLWQGLDRVIEDYLAGVTLQDLIDRQREHSGDDYVI